MLNPDAHSALPIGLTAVHTAAIDLLICDLAWPLYTPQTARARVAGIHLIGSTNAAAFAPKDGYSERWHLDTAAQTEAALHSAPGPDLCGQTSTNPDSRGRKIITALAASDLDDTNEPKVVL